MEFFTNPCEAMNLVEEQSLDSVIVCAYTLLSTILLLGMNFCEYGTLLAPPSTSASGASSSPRSTALALQACHSQPAAGQYLQGGCPD